MSQLDIYRLRGAAGLFLDCQSDALLSLETRLLAPLMPPSEIPGPLNARLNPRFMIAGSPYLLVSQFAAAVRQSELLMKVGSLNDDDRDIVIAAFDLLLTGV